MVRRKFTQTKLFLALVFFGILLFFTFFQPLFLMKPLRVVATTISFPLEKMFSVVAFEVSDTFHFFASVGELKTENERLEKEQMRLSVENAKLQDIKKENEELRSEIGLLPRKEFTLKPAQVIGRDASGLGNWISIDQGSLQGIQKDMSVIVGAGALVGKVADVAPSSARVMLISNPESLINGVTIDTDARGIVKGEHGLGLLLDLVLQNDTLKPGDSVVTSGLGGDMPEGLLIGTLQEPRFSDDRLFQQASIASPVKFDKLRYVFIIQNVQK